MVYFKSSIEIKNLLNPFILKKMSTNITAMYSVKNRVQLIGNLGSAPEVRSTKTGKKFVRFSLATNESYQNAKGEKVTETQWHNVIAWDKIAEIAEKNLAKGSEVSVEGKLINNNYTDKSGTKRYSVEVQANKLMLLSKMTA
jgi:single-strand DNA-binding protein